MERDRRGLTLLELLLVIGLLLALGALVFPAVASRLDRRAFESSVETLRHQLLVARSHARLERRAVEVRYLPDPPAVQARFHVPGADATRDRGAFGDDARPELDGFIGEGWAHQPLPDGVRIAAGPAYTFDDDGVDPFTTFADPDALAGGEEPGYAILRLAIFLPDGAALPGDPVWIVHENGQKARVTVDGWTGLPAIALSAPPQELDPQEEDGQDEAPEDELELDETPLEEEGEPLDDEETPEP